MHLPEIYAEIQARLNTLDFPALFEHFRPFKFALYTDTECFFDGSPIEKTAEFCANTATLYHGEPIAIWQIHETPADFDALTASIVHEMFHAFQLVCGERRYADEMDALLRYRYCAGHLRMKLAEAQHIRRILIDHDGEALPPLLQLRRARHDAYPYEYEYEAKIEQIEGTANDVELQALTQLNAAAGHRAWRRVLARIAQPKRYFPVRVSCYDTGAALFSCLRACTTMDVFAFDDVPFSVAMLRHAPAGTIHVPTSADAIACLAEYNAETHRIIAGAIETGECVLEGSYPLVSVNVYDARCEGAYVVSNYFLAYLDGCTERVLRGDFVVQLDERQRIRKVFRQAKT